MSLFVVTFFTWLWKATTQMFRIISIIMYDVFQYADNACVTFIWAQLLAL